ncbi:hypothetical protein GCM10025881_24580 [Pseudolysinimonas kribbensis]|uniref:Uncharacterized protein n=1 Tax=Pseudolysinimonas kribbensis TaxID=433641 RepID=A0ABQ6K8C4_9MICO|nr:hypothetical protein GCM10025881_24580 [Pseudolysinimonas kribbensis]
MVLQRPLDQLEQGAVGVVEEGQTHPALGLEGLEMEPHPRLVKRGDDRVESGDLEPDVTEPGVQIVGDPRRRGRPIHAPEADRRRHEVEVGTVLGDLPDRDRGEEAGVEVDRARDVGDVQQDGSDGHGLALRRRRSAAMGRSFLHYDS